MQAGQLAWSGDKLTRRTSVARTWGGTQSRIVNDPLSRRQRAGQVKIERVIGEAAAIGTGFI
jgi:hypothetical protein